MRSRFTLVCFAALLVASVQAQDSRTRASGSSAGASSAAGKRTATARGPLPDPALLDGSSQPKENKPDYGMLGEFEIPGDNNAKSDRVGGQRGQPGGGGQQDPNQQGMQISVAGLPPMGLPQGSAAGGAGGLPSMQMPQGGAQAGGAGLPGGKPVDPSQANGQAGGSQVAELKTDEANAGGVGGGEPGAPKPGQVTIGDPAMQIRGAANAPGVVGAVAPAGNTQQMEKGVGGGKGAGSSLDNTNKGVEKGRVVPAGL